MHTPQRRTFILTLAATGAVLATARAQAQTPASVDEADPQAKALGYAADTTKADGAKFPKHEASQTCQGCQLFQGKVKDAKGPCTLFAGKLVTPNGWCSAWIKKVG
jgi:hypothetical protein